MHQADSIYQLVLPLHRNSSSATYRSMANVCINLHQFRRARAYLDSAVNLGDDKYLTLLMLFDVEMELGNHKHAKHILHAFGKSRSFEVLIRKAKYKDQVEGKLEEAISLMEEAYAKIQRIGNEELELWSLSNLGDYYSHANRFSEAYQNYLKVLQIDPGYYHALNGIGWLAFSKDKDFINARQIFEYLVKQHPVPDYYLPIAEIYAMQGKMQDASYFNARFLNESTNLLYGDMYNKYIFFLYSDELKNYEDALRIAQREVNNRPSPESYDLLAWAHLKKGNTERALTISKLSVENLCFDPLVLYHLGVINLPVDKKKAKKFLTEASESSVELGPLISGEIEKLLKGI
jgi:tetratricopeptide (TPR) repeat protein